MVTELNLLRFEVEICIFRMLMLKIYREILRRSLFSFHTCAINAILFLNKILPKVVYVYFQRISLTPQYKITLPYLLLAYAKRGIYCYFILLWSLPFLLLTLSEIFYYCRSNTRMCASDVLEIDISTPRHFSQLDKSIVVLVSKFNNKNRKELCNSTDN